MKKIKLILVLIAAIFVMNSCSNKNNNDSSSSEGKAKAETKVVKRPDSTNYANDAISGPFGKFDTKVASVMEMVGNCKDAAKNNNAKMTPVIEKNISETIKEAYILKGQVEKISDSLSKEDFDNFGRDIGYLKESEVDFENIKQNKQ